jgi:demethylmenaquinone methyltransferase/2-methoxy-6-polyprenyl-1,4-benzoquinol methylase
MVRNVPDLGRAFAEQVRVVKPRGRVVCLELTWPSTPLLRAAFPAYFGRLVPLLGGLIAGDRSAYSYLPASVAAFPRPAALAATLEQAGLVSVRWRLLGCGAVTLHVGTRPE